MDTLEKLDALLFNYCYKTDVKHSAKKEIVKLIFLEPTLYKAYKGELGKRIKNYERYKKENAKEFGELEALDLYRYKRAFEAIREIENEVKNKVEEFFIL